MVQVMRSRGWDPHPTCERGYDIIDCPEMQGSWDGLQIWVTGKRLPLGTAEWGYPCDIVGNLPKGHIARAQG